MKKSVVAILTILFTPFFALALATIDLNTASTDQIESLPSVGKATALLIVAARPYKSVDDLKNVKGIGDGKFAKLKDLVSVSAAPVVAKPSAPTIATGVTSTSQTKKTATTGLAPQSININSASLEQLESLPGIGPAKAKAILSARPFSSVEDLTRVKGIKEKILAKIKPYITVN